MKEWKSFVNFPSGTLGERNKGMQSNNGQDGGGPPWSHCVSAFFVCLFVLLSLYSLIVLFKLHCHAKCKEKIIYSYEWLCIKIDSARTDVIFHHVPRNTSSAMLQGGKSKVCVWKTIVYYFWGHKMCTASAVFSYFLQLIKHLHWYWCGPVGLILVSVIDLILDTCGWS